MPVAVAHPTAESPKPVAPVDQESGLVAVLDLPCFLGRPPGTRATHPHLRMVAEVDHPGRIVNRTATPTLPRRCVGVSLGCADRHLHGQLLAAWPACVLRAFRRSRREGTFRWPSGVGYTRQAIPPPVVPLSNRSAPSTTNAGEPAKRRALATASVSMTWMVNCASPRPMSSSAVRSNSAASSAPGQSGITSSSISTRASWLGRQVVASGVRSLREVVDRHDRMHSTGGRS